jgi:hypothetical protein
LTGKLLECGDNDSEYDEGDSDDEITDELKNLDWTKQHHDDENEEEGDSGSN